jgi:predicted site-specific integrase-resolvase
MNGTKESKYISIREASKITGICAQTLRKLADTQKIRCYKTLSNQRKFDRQSLEELCNNFSFDTKIREVTRKNFLYARVSSRKQMDDLSRQIDFIRSKCSDGITYELISDVASGINFKRKGLQTILDACLQGTIGEIIVAHRDRLCRFGFDLIKLIVTKSGGSINVINDQQNKSSEQELSEDLLSIIHIYSCRQMGKRSYKTKQFKEDIKNQIEINRTTT